MLEWKKAATPTEIRRVETIDRRIARSAKSLKTLKIERRTIIMRCNVRAWRNKQ